MKELPLRKTWTMSNRSEHTNELMWSEWISWAERHASFVPLSIPPISREWLINYVDRIVQVTPLQWHMLNHAHHIDYLGWVTWLCAFYQMSSIVGGAHCHRSNAKNFCQPWTEIQMKIPGVHIVCQTVWCFVRTSVTCRSSRRMRTSVVGRWELQMCHACVP